MRGLPCLLKRENVQFKADKRDKIERDVSSRLLVYMKVFSSCPIF